MGLPLDPDLAEAARAPLLRGEAWVNLFRAEDCCIPGLTGTVRDAWDAWENGTGEELNGIPVYRASCLRVPAEDYLAVVGTLPE